MTTQNEKYIVFKREDWDRLLKENAEVNEPTDWGWGGLEVHDAVVIRRQDVFAPAGLNAYAHSIAIAVNIIKAMAPELADSLQRSADYFHEQAELAMDEAHKLPD